MTGATCGTWDVQPSGAPRLNSTIMIGSSNSFYIFAFVLLFYHLIFSFLIRIMGYTIVVFLAIAITPQWYIHDIFRGGRKTHVITRLKLKIPFAQKIIEHCTRLNLYLYFTLSFFLWSILCIVIYRLCQNEFWTLRTLHFCSYSSNAVKIHFVCKTPCSFSVSRMSRLYLILNFVHFTYAAHVVQRVCRTF